MLESYQVEHNSQNIYFRSIVGAAEAVAAVPRRHAAHAASILRKPLRRAGIGESLR